MDCVMIKKYLLTVATLVIVLLFMLNGAEPWQNQQNECAPSEYSDQPGHPPSLIRVFAVRMKKAWVLSYPLNGQRRLWSDWADAQADLSFRWAHSHFVGFVMSWLKWSQMLISLSKASVCSFHCVSKQRWIYRLAWGVDISCSCSR